MHLEGLSRGGGPEPIVAAVVEELSSYQEAPRGVEMHVRCLRNLLAGHGLMVKARLLALSAFACSPSPPSPRVRCRRSS